MKPEIEKLLAELSRYVPPEKAALIDLLHLKLRSAEKAEAEAARYRRIRLKAWLDSCVDDLVIGTGQAKESEFNAGYDTMVDAEYPTLSAARDKGASEHE